MQALYNLFSKEVLQKIHINNNISLEQLPILLDFLERNKNDSDFKDFITFDTRLIGVLRDYVRLISYTLDEIAQGADFPPGYNNDQEFAEQELILGKYLQYGDKHIEEKFETIQQQLTKDLEFQDLWNKIGNLTDQEILTIGTANVDPKVQECLKIFTLIETKYALPYTSTISGKQLFFWSTDAAYKDILNLMKQGQPIITDKDVPAQCFFLYLNNQRFPEKDYFARTPKENAVYEKYIKFLSASFALQCSNYPIFYIRSDVYNQPNSLMLNTFFWNIELPVLRNLQQQGKVNQIFINYQDTPYSMLQENLDEFNRYLERKKLYPTYDDNPGLADINPSLYFPNQGYSQPYQGLIKKPRLKTTKLRNLFQRQNKNFQLSPEQFAPHTYVYHQAVLCCNQDFFTYKNIIDILTEQGGVQKIDYLTNVRARYCYINDYCCPQELAKEDIDSIDLITSKQAIRLYEQIINPLLANDLYDKDYELIQLILDNHNQPKQPESPSSTRFKF